MNVPQIYRTTFCGVRRRSRRFSVVQPSLHCAPLKQLSSASHFSALPPCSLRLRVILFLFFFSPLATRHSPLLPAAENPPA
jgi:hypothetical protein